MGKYYSTELRGQKLIIVFSRRPPKEINDGLIGFGFKKYNRMLFIGGRNHDEAKAMCERYYRQMCRKLPNKTLPPTLCWECQNVYSGCEWSREYKPVDGWTAKKTKINVLYSAHGEFVPTHVESYCVLKCPKFVHD